MAIRVGALLEFDIYSCNDGKIPDIFTSFSLLFDEICPKRGAYARPRKAFLGLAEPFLLGISGDLYHWTEVVCT